MKTYYATSYWYSTNSWGPTVTQSELRRRAFEAVIYKLSK